MKSFSAKSKVLIKRLDSWEAKFRIENNRNPSADEKNSNPDYTRYRALKLRRKSLQDLQQRTVQESSTGGPYSDLMFHQLF